MVLEINEELAELYGAMIGDGCLTIAKRKKYQPRRIAHLTGHLKNDIGYYTDILRPILLRNFGVHGYLQPRTQYNCFYMIMSSCVFDFVHGLGFPVGKKTGQLLIPDQILANTKFSTACVRGIFNTDGSVYRRYSRKYNKHSRVYDHMVLQIKMKDLKIIRQIKHILNTLEIRSNNIIFDRGHAVLRITDQKQLELFFDKVSPSNHYHLERYLNRCCGNDACGPIAQPG